MGYAIALESVGWASLGAIALIAVIIVIVLRWAMR